MTTSVQAIQAKIERIVNRDLRFPDAEFFHLRESGRWFAAGAWFTDAGPKIGARSGLMTVEQAAIVGVALQMAIDWVTEEQAKGVQNDTDEPLFAL